MAWCDDCGWPLNWDSDNMWERGVLDTGDGDGSFTAGNLGFAFYPTDFIEVKFNSIIANYQT